jgi:hypothetical protein
MKQPKLGEENEVKESEFRFSKKTTGERAASPRKSPRAKKTAAKSPAKQTDKTAAAAAVAVAAPPVALKQGDEVELKDLLRDVKKSCVAGGKQTMEVWAKFEKKAVALLPPLLAELYELQVYDEDELKVILESKAEDVAIETNDEPEGLVEEHAQFLDDLRKNWIDQEAVCQAVIKADVVTLGFTQQVDWLLNVRDAATKRLVELSNALKSEPVMKKSKKKKAKTGD